MVTAEDKDMLSTNNNDYRSYRKRKTRYRAIQTRQEHDIFEDMLHYFNYSIILLISDIIISALWSRPFADIIIRKHYKWRVN